MSALAAPAVEATGPADTTGSGRWRRARWPLLVGVLLIAAVVLRVLTQDPTGTGARLDPDGAGRDGARAVTRVLADQGVAVDVARDAAALERARPGADTTVVVSSSEALGPSTVDRLVEAADGARVVVVEPGPALLDLLPLPARTPDPAAGTEEPLGACPDPLFTDLRLVVDARDTVDAVAGSVSCFDRSLVLGPDLVLLGAGDLLTNDQVLRGDNAAIALRLLGARDRLVWYVPDATDLGGEDAVSLRSLLPAPVVPGLTLLGLTMLAVILWRGRRLGRLAIEPLPVVVRALETTLSRGRLYHRIGDRAHTAAVLRRATRRRLAARLGLAGAARGATVPTPVLLAALTARLPGRTDLDDLLADEAPTPAHDRALVDLARALTQLEEEVRRP
ncbi:DUF4350 domain-containing protein [Nocardioides sp.]|uniref:DUF4350 domain-containing protein n=1 Tax=Nocardioides sp. TaxID=35761 RepID=UPI0035176E15